MDTLSHEDGQLDRDAIKKIIPYAEPFLFLDRITLLNRERVVAVWAVHGEEDFLKGHFVGFPIVPAALIIEGLGQAASLLLRHVTSVGPEVEVLPLKIREAKIRSPAFPGDTIRYEVSLLRQTRRCTSFRGRVFVEERLIAQAELVLAVVERRQFREWHDTTRTADGEDRPEAREATS